MSVELCSLPEETIRKLCRYPEIPATRIGRLAVDHRWRSMRLGEYLLLDALNKSWQQSHKIGALAVIVDAKNDEARQFYEKYDFKAFPDHPSRLFLPMNIVKKIFQGQQQGTLCCELYHVARFEHRRTLIPRPVEHPKGAQVNYPA